jgi:hypothetical protein
VHSERQLARYPWPATPTAVSAAAAHEVQHAKTGSWTRTTATAAATAATTVAAAVATTAAAVAAAAAVGPRCAAAKAFHLASKHIDAALRALPVARSDVA